MFSVSLCIAECVREGERKKKACREALGVVEKLLIAALYARGVLIANRISTEGERVSDTPSLFLPSKSNPLVVYACTKVYACTAIAQVPASIISPLCSLPA